MCRAVFGVLHKLKIFTDRVNSLFPFLGLPYHVPHTRGLNNQNGLFHGLQATIQGSRSYLIFASSGALNGEHFFLEQKYVLWWGTYFSWISGGEHLFGSWSLGSLGLHWVTEGQLQAMHPCLWSYHQTCDFTGHFPVCFSSFLLKPSVILPLGPILPQCDHRTT